MHWNKLKIVLLVALSFAIINTGCAPKMINSHLVSLNDANDGGNALEVYILHLSDNSKLNGISSQEFWRQKNDLDQALAGHIVDQDIKTIYPGKVTIIELEPHQDSQFIAFVANFFSPDPNNWFEIINVESWKGKSVYISISNNSIELRENLK